MKRGLVVLSVFELLTDRDKELIEDYIGAYANYNCDITKTNNYKGLQRVLHEWDNEKSIFLEKMFEGQLILHRPFTYKMSSDGLEREYKNLVKENSAPLDMVHSWLRGLYVNGYLDVEQYYIIDEIFTVIPLVNNAYNGESFIIKDPEGLVVKKPLKIMKGMKPTRVLSALAERFDPSFLTPDSYTGRSSFDDFCIWYSKLFNQATIDGELCLSIHPLDFMTMSDNDNGWDSCMAWSRECNPGYYRAGTVECMNSPYIVVAYLHNPKHTMTHKSFRLLDEDFEWNSKRWRELFIVQEGVIMEIKGYPYQDENLTNAALMWIKELAAKNLGWEYNDEELNVQDNIDIDEENFYSITPETTYHMYNDIGTLTTHRMRVNYPALKSMCEDRPHHDTNSNFYESCYHEWNSERWHHIYTIPYGGDATCMCCGDYLDCEEERSDKVLCQSCFPGYKCDCCGEWIEGEAYYVENADGPICSYCWENSTVNDDITGETYLDGDCNIIELKWAPITDENGECLLDNYNETPIFYDDTVWTYDPEYNISYKDIFTKEPLEYYQKFRGWGGKQHFYVTNDMIKDVKRFKEIFYIRGDINQICEEYKHDYLEEVDDATEVFYKPVSSQT